MQRIVCRISDGKRGRKLSLTAHLFPSLQPSPPVTAIPPYGRCLSLGLPAQSLPEQWEQNDWVSSALGQDLISLTTT